MSSLKEDKKNGFLSQSATRLNDASQLTAPAVQKSSKLGGQEESGISLETNSKSAIQSKKVHHHPQVIDEDTERFKLRLEDLVNRFKLETLTEFMTAKRNLLDEQASVLNSERMVSETKYQSKCFEL